MVLVSNVGSWNGRVILAAACAVSTLIACNARDEEHRAKTSPATATEKPLPEFLASVPALTKGVLLRKPDGEVIADVYRDLTSESGVQFSYRNGQEAGRYSILESLGGGVALLDYDGDGLLDIFATGGGYFAGP